MSTLQILQNILLPSEETCTETALYFRSGSDAAVRRDGSLLLPAGGSVSFDTYFNSFAAAKWHTYTHAPTPVLILRISGSVQVTLYHKYGSAKGEVKNTILAREVCKSDAPRTFSIPFPDESPEDLFCFSLKSTSGSSVFYGGCYAARMEAFQQRPVKLALSVCTYRRESYMERNLRNLRRFFLDNSRSPLSSRMEVFVSDNAGTLDAESLADEKVHIFKSRNLGGVGGYARCILEIQKCRREKGFTHILFCDDDIVYEPEAIFRTYAFLSCLRQEYADAFAGGSMVRMDKPYLQVEAGALWNGGMTVSLKHGLDLRRLDAVMYDQRQEEPQYAAWWFLAVPADVPTEGNLPMPLFTRGDDAEYGLRCMKQFIQLPGVCVWHEPMEHRYSSCMFYYMLRNRLICNALHGIAVTAGEFKKQLEELVTGELQLYRYKNAGLLLDGAEDFLRGTGWLLRQEGDTLHERIVDKGYKLESMEQLGPEAVFDAQMYESSCNAEQPYDLKHRIIADKTINGTFLPPERRYNVVPCEGVWPISVYRTELVLNYDRASKRGFMTKRDKKTAKDTLERMKLVFRQIDLKYDYAVQDYAENGKRFWTRDFWEEYLGLNE